MFYTFEILEIYNNLHSYQKIMKMPIFDLEDNTVHCVIKLPVLFIW
jgi:hypothetical protein